MCALMSSHTSTLKPSLRRAMAAESPAIPPPITPTSKDGVMEPMLPIRRIRLCEWWRSECRDWNKQQRHSGCSAIHWTSTGIYQRKLFMHKTIAIDIPKPGRTADVMLDHRENSHHPDRSRFLCYGLQMFIFCPRTKSSGVSVQQQQQRHRSNTSTEVSVPPFIRCIVEERRSAVTVKIRLKWKRAQDVAAEATSTDLPSNHGSNDD